MDSVSADVKRLGDRRRDKYCIDIVDDLPSTLSLMDSKAAIWIGAVSITQAPRRWLLRGATVNLFGYEQSPFEITRDYLTVRYPRRRRRTSEQIRACAGRQAALLAVPSRPQFDCVYIDVKAAYYSIVCRTGWDVDYYPGHWLASSGQMTDWLLPMHKSARNYLVSIGVRERTQALVGGKLKDMGANKFVNWGLWALVQDVLHSIAAFARDECNALYVNTDGYIVPERDADRLLNYIEQWGLTARVDAWGRAQVYGVGSYRVGDKVTKRLSYYPHYYDNISDQVNAEWLRTRFARLT